MAEAENLMYKDKAAYYAATGIEREIKYIMDSYQEKEKKKYRVRFSGWMIFKMVAWITIILLALALPIAIIVFNIVNK